MRTFLFCSLLLVSASASAQFHVGNGGQGVRYAGRIVSRDLYERGTAMAPYFGIQLEPAIRERLRGSAVARLLSGDHAFLERKLTDLYRLRPLLGLAVAQAIGQFTVEISETRLLPLPQDANGALPVVQLAVRQGGHLILAPEWRRLNGPQRAALLVHEGMYTLLTVRCDAAHCDQASVLVRDLVGDAFSASMLNSAEYRARLAARLDLPAPGAECAVRPELSLGPVGQAASWGGFFTTTEELVSRLPQACSVIRASAPGLRLRIAVPGWVLFARPYRAPGRLQSGLSVVPKGQTLDLELPPAGDDCESLMARVGRDFRLQALRETTFLFEEVCPSLKLSATDPLSTR